MLTETRADASEAFRRVWPGAVKDQALPIGVTGREGVAVAVKPGFEVRFTGSWASREENRDGLTK